MVGGLVILIVSPKTRRFFCSQQFCPRLDRIMVRKMTMKPETMECEACARCFECNVRIGNGNRDWLWVDRNHDLAMLTGTNPQPSCDRPPRWTKFCVWCHVTRLELRLQISETQQELLLLKVDELQQELDDLKQLHTEKLQQDFKDLKPMRAKKCKRKRKA